MCSRNNNNYYNNNSNKNNNNNLRWARNISRLPPAQTSASPRASAPFTPLQVRHFFLCTFPSTSLHTALLDFSLLEDNLFFFPAILKCLQLSVISSFPLHLQLFLQPAFPEFLCQSCVAEVLNHLPRHYLRPCTPTSNKPQHVTVTD